MCMPAALACICALALLLLLGADYGRPFGIGEMNTVHVTGPRISANPADFMQVIREAFPNHAILGEEGGVFGDTSSEYLWCERCV